MDIQSYSGLLPLGGASALLVYLLRIWLIEQRRYSTDLREREDRWAREREELIANHRADVADHEADYQRHIARLRERVRELEEQLDVARKTIRDLIEHKDVWRDPQ